MRIIVDAFGGDNAPLEVLKGCAAAVEEYGCDILLCGREAEIKQVAAQNSISLNKMTIADAPDVISMEEHPGEIMKSMKNCSMAEGLRRLAAGEGDAFVSGGSTGALLLGSTFIVKRIKGVKRCALAPIIPSNKGFYMLIDSGANVECRPEALEQFAVMGSAYMERVMKVKNPEVGLANIGTEPTKGGDLQLAAYDLLSKNRAVNFVGNVEARELPYGACDVVVCDGFTGNTILKLTEGMAGAMMDNLKAIFKKNFAGKAAASLIMPGLKAFKKRMSTEEYGGAPLMGTQKPVFKAHGNSGANAFKNAIRVSIDFAKGGVVDVISQNVTKNGAE